VQLKVRVTFLQCQQQQQQQHDYVTDDVSHSFVRAGHRPTILLINIITFFFFFFFFYLLK